MVTESTNVLKCIKVCYRYKPSMPPTYFGHNFDHPHVIIYNCIYQCDINNLPHTPALIWFQHHDILHNSYIEHCLFS
jgi:hypothetical protein